MYKRHSNWEEDKWDIHSDKGSSGAEIPSSTAIELAQTREQLARVEEHLKHIDEKLDKLWIADVDSFTRSTAASGNRAAADTRFIAFSSRVDAKLNEHDNILERQNKLIWIVILENAGVLMAIIGLVVKLIEFMGGP